MSAGIRITDAAGRSWAFAEAPRRVVSLVPSLTHSLVEMGHASALAGRTRYCGQPAEKVAAIPIVGGTKDPDVDRILAMEPDLVLMDMEENRAADCRRMLEAGLRVLAVFPTAAADVAPMLRDLAGVFRSAAPVRRRINRLATRLAEARDERIEPIPVFCALWRGPYLSCNGRTYISSILEATGFRNVLADRPERYFHVDPTGLRLPPDTRVFLPTEPYPFEGVPLPSVAAELGVPVERIFLVQGELLTWPGLMMPEALESLRMLRRHLDAE
jgi:ABC-type Fe3+-hydroxamate transport system substrate-binding protein